MAIRVLQNAFNGGEVAPYLYGRIDDQKFSLACATLRNFICRVQGPAVRRPGFEFVEATKYAGKKTRLIPFKFNSDQTCVIELGDHYARFHSYGMTVYRNGAIYEITTPYDSEDLDTIEYTQTADVVTLVHLNYPPQELVRHQDAYGVYFTITPINFTLGVKPPTGLTATNTYTGETGEYIKTDRYTVKYVVTSVKDTADGTVESEASSAVSVKCNLYLNDSSNSLGWSAADGADRYRVYKTYSGLYGYIGETSDTTFLDNNLDADEGITPPKVDEVFSTTKGISSVTVTNGGGGYTKAAGSLADAKPKTGDDYMWEFTSVDAIPQITWSVYDEKGTGYGGSVDIVLERWVSSTTSFGHTYVTNHVGIKYVNVIEAGQGYTEPRVKVVASNLYRAVWDESGDGSTYWRGTEKRANITKYISMPMDEDPPKAYITDATGSGAELRVKVGSNGVITGIQVLKSGSNYTNPSVVISASVGSGATATASIGEGNDYPGAVGYYDQRRCFAGTTKQPKMMWLTRPGTETNFTYTIPTQDDNRIKFNVAAQEAGRINHIVPLTQLILTTPSAELRVQSVNSDALSPTSFSVKPQAYVGASFVHPQVFNSVMLYVAERGSHIRELGYSNQAGGFTTGDLSVRATHLFDNDKVMDIALAKAPDQILWAVTRSGKLLGMTYMPDQNVAAWHRHDTEGLFESICVVPEDDEDILYAVVRRTINGKEVRYVERMHERENVAIEDSFFVDCGIEKTYETATDEITGLAPLAGMTVSILADGGVLPDMTVSTDGKLTLPLAVKKAIIGLPFVSDLETLPAAYQAQDGSYGRGHMKNINKVWIRVYRSSGIFVGPSFENLAERKPRQDEAYGEAPTLVSDEVEVSIPPSWSRSGQLAIRQTYPLPLVVVGITADFAQ